MTTHVKVSFGGQSLRADWLLVCFSKAQRHHVNPPMTSDLSHTLEKSVTVQ